MNDPIVSPFLVYIINIADSAKIFSIIIASLFAVAAFVGVVIMLANSGYGSTDDDFKTGKIIFRKSFPVAIIASILAVFIPSEKTMIEMLVFRSLTPELINDGVQKVKEIFDYVVNAINTLR